MATGYRPTPRLGRGNRLMDPRDPVVRVALTRSCPSCNSKPDEWCIAVGGRRKGRRITRIHFSRCTFKPAQ